VKRLLPIAVACSALMLAACRGEPESEGALGQPVTLNPVLAMDLVDRIEATGELLAKEHAQIAAEVGGRITEVLIDEGARVEAGAEVLAIDPERRSLERDSARAGAEEARENLREQEREYGRMRDLRAGKVASQTRLDQVETDLKLAKSRLLAAEAQLGVVERALRDATVTAVVPGQELFELVCLDPIEVEFRVTEVDSGLVALGQTVDVRVAPFPDETFGATVTFVSPTIDTRTRTLRVKAQLENPEGRLRPGLFARVDLGISAREGIPMILEEAILRRADGAVVFRANGQNRVERIVIETGVYHEGYVEVVRGLAPGEMIVSRGQARLVDGQLVAPRNPDGTLLSRPMPDVSEAPESQR
jgi:membrane fusion protein (multidrug efflux system)